MSMGLWDDIKHAAGNVKDSVGDAAENVGDFFGGGGGDAPKARPIQGVRPEYQGNPFKQLNPAYAQRQDEFEKPLWMTGADPQSPYGSWNSEYLDRVFKQQEKLVEKGKLGDQFDEKDATGIVTWDHVTKGGKDLKFGDVFDKGKLVGNLYEDKDGNEADADLMMGQFLLEPEELKQIGADRDPQARMRSTIAQRREDNNVEIPQALGVQEQQKSVDETQGKIQGAFGGKGDDLLSGGLGFGGGALLGSVFGPVGTIVGGGIGGAAAWLNRDDISEQTASALEISRKAYEDGEGNVIGDTASAAKQWAGVAGRGLSPLSNLVRGAADTDRGNGVGALQEEDRPGWAKPLDVAATIGDMGLTFGSTAGIRAYTGQMGVHSAGAITELTLGGGQRWDPQAGEFKNVYENEQGEFSPANAAGAWGSTAIDVAQLAMVRGIASKIEGTSQKAIGTEINGGTVASVEAAAGRTFYRDSSGKVLDSRVNWGEVFVPSEGVQFLAAGGAARAAAARREGAAVMGKGLQDDLYRESMALTRAEAPIKAALVNAVGEGTEEATQEALDTWSFDHKVDMQSLAEAYAYGAASGLGMGLAANYRTRANDDKQLEAITRSGYELQHGEMDNKEWAELYKNGMTAEDKRGYRASNYSDEERAWLKKALSTSIAEQGGSTASGLIISNAAAKAMELEQDKLTSKAGVGGRTIMRAGANTFQSLKARGQTGGVTIQNGAVADDSGATGFTGLLNQYTEKLKRLPEVLSSIDAQIAQAEATKAQQPDSTEADAQIERLKDTKALWEGTKPTLEQIVSQLQGVAEPLMRVSTDEATNRLRRADVDKINTYLDQLYRSSDDSVALAAARFRLRSPYDNVGSLYVTAPALDWSMVRDGFDGTETMDLASLDTTTADFDGDRITGATSLVLGRNGFRNSRNGTTWINTVTNKSGQSVTSYKVASLGHDEAISTNLHLVHTGLRTSSARKSPAKAVAKFAEMVGRRYQLSAADVREMRRDLVGLLLDQQNETPIETLMTYVAQVENPVAERMSAYAEANNSNEASVLTGLYRAVMDQAVAEVNEARKALLPSTQRVKTTAPTPNMFGIGQTLRSQEATTLYDTFLQYYGTSDSLRLGQVLRLSGQDYTDTGVKRADQVPLLVAAGAELRELAKGKIEAAYEGGLDPFDVTARVHEMALDITGGDHAEAYRLLTSDFGAVQYEGKDPSAAPYNVKVAQAFTNAIVTQLRRQGATAISRDQVLQNKLRLLETASRDTQSPNEKTRSNGEMLILRDALGMFNVADVAGIGSAAGWETSGLLTQGTISQNSRMLGQHDRSSRRTIKAAMLDAADNAANPDLYRDMVAFITELTNTEYSIDEKSGRVHGRVADRNDSAAVAARTVRQNVRDAVQKLGFPLTHEGVLDALTTQNGQVILEAFIKQTGIASFTKDKNGVFQPRSWILDYFTTKKDGEAEVLLWRNRALTALHLGSQRKQLSAEIKDEEVRNEYARVDDSLARLIIHLRDINPLLLSQLEIEMQRATSREALEDWINKNAYSFKAPVLMYENSMTQFDPSLPSGGWTTAASTFGTDIREVVDQSATFATRTTEMIERRLVNVAAARALLQRMSDPKDGQVRNARESLATAANADLFKTMDPNDTQEALTRIHLFGKNMHVKGAELEALRSMAAQQVGELIQTGRADPFVDSTNVALGVYDISDLRNRPELVFSTGAFVDEHGRLVKMPDLLDPNGNPDLRLVLKAIADDKKTGLADLLSEAWLPRAYKHNRQADISTVVTRGPKNLQELFEHRFDGAFATNAQGRYTTSADMVFGVEVSAAAQSADQKAVSVFERAVLAIATPRILSGRDAVDASEIATITDEARHQLATVLRMAGQFINSPEGSLDLYRDQVRDAAKLLIEQQTTAQRDRQRTAGTYRVLTTSQRGRVEEQILAGLSNAMRGREDAVAVNELVEKVGSGHYTDEQQEALLQEIIDNPTSGPITQLFQSIANGDPYGDLEFLYGSTEVQTPKQRTAIASYLNTHPEIDSLLLHSPSANNAIAYFREPTLSYAAQKWDVLRNIVVSHIIQTESNPVTSQSDFLVVFDDPIRQDPTFSALFKSLLMPDNNPLLAASVGVTASHAAPVDIKKMRRAMEALFPADGSVRWDQSVGAMTEALDATFPSVSAGQAATVHGNTAKTADALSMAARTNSQDIPGPEYLQTVRVRRAVDGIQIIGSPSVPTGSEMLDGAIGIVAGKTLEAMRIPGLQGPYQGITHARLERALNLGEEVDVQFFHPMHRPYGAKWHNSLYFDGVAAHNSPIVPEFPSLIAEMYMQPNGITQLGTRFTLDAVKKKLPALHRTSVTPQGGLDLTKVSDPTEFLGSLASLLSGTELGYGTLGNTWFRGILKYVTMRHVVLYDDGTASSVYDYLASRAADQDGTMARKPQLIPLSERTANTLYGEVGTQGLRGFNPSGRLSYGQQLFSWDALTEDQLKVIRNLSEPVDLADTSAATRAALSGVSRGSQAEFRAAQRDYGSLYALEEQAAATQVDRRSKFQSLGVNLDAMRTNQAHTANAALVNDMQATAMQAVPDRLESLLGGMMHKTSAFSSSASFHLVLTQNDQDYLGGNVTPQTWDSFRKNLGDMVFGDSILLDLDAFTDRDLTDVLKVVTYMVNHKVTVAVRGGKSGDIRPAVQTLLEQTSDYAPVEGQTGTYAPIEALAIYQMERAYISRAMEQRNTSAESRLLTFIPTEGQAGFGSITESAAAIINPGKRQILRNLLLKQNTSEYLTPIHRADMQAVRDLIVDPAFIEDLLADVPETEGAGLTHAEAVADLLKRAHDGELSLTTENLHLRKGMFEVYVVRGARMGDPLKVYLHRAGSRFVDDGAIAALRRSGSRSFVTGPVETEAQQTFVEGTVVGSRVRGDGLLLNVQSDQFWRNNKLIPHLGGNKVMTQALAEDLKWLESALAGDLSFDLVVNSTDSMKKLSMMDTVRDFATAAELLGFDNMAVFYEGAYGETFDADSTNSQERMAALRTMLNGIASDNTGKHDDVEALVDFLARGLTSDYRIVALTARDTISPDMVTTLGQANRDSVPTRVLLAAMAYLTLPRAQLSDIETAGGYTSADARRPGRGSRRMPDMFTRIYDRADDTREFALREFSGRLEDNVDLLDDYSIRIHHGSQFTTGHIAFTNYSVVGENQGDNYDPTVAQGASSHDARLVEQAAQASFANNFDEGLFNRFIENATTEDTVSPIRTAGKAGLRQVWYNIGIAQQTFRNRVAERMTWYFHRIDLTADERVSDADVQAVEDRIRKLAKALFRDDSGNSDRHVHTMIRLMLGRPAASKPDEEQAALIGLSKVELALNAMEQNMKAGYTPLRRGAVSLIPVEIRNAIIKANVGVEGGWAPRVWTGKRLSNEHADTADSYTRAFFDHALADPEANNIDSFNGIMDAIYHQYQQTSGDALSLPASLDLVKDLRLISKDPQAAKALAAAIKNESTMAEFAKEYPAALATSMFRGMEIQLTPQVLHDMTSSATISQQLGMDGTEIEIDPPSSELLSYVEARIASSASKRDVPYPTKRSTQQVRDSGAAYTHNDSNSHRLFRNLLALHGAKALLNPALGLGALVDSQMRKNIRNARMLATGESIGPVGRRVANVVESQGRIGALARGFGYRVMYTEQQRKDLQRILKTTALTGPMSEAIYKELTSYTAELNKSGVARSILALNKAATAIQDLGYGTKGGTMRGVYLETAIADLVFRQGQDLDTVLAKISYDGAWISKMHPTSHNAGVQAMNDLRGTQETMMSSAISAAIRPLTHSGNAGVNAVAQMTLAMPLMFQRYASNLFLTLTGARAFDQLAAHALRGRAKPGFWQEMSAKAAGRDTIDPVINMDDVIGGLDAMDAVINMGVTHSLLFTGGLVAGGLGLTGEDEEEKRRRRAAAAQGAVWLSDPREIENDFRNAHALFLDEIPGLNMLFANDSGRAVASPHWIVKPLTSPVLGMQRFFETGDIRQLKWGFEDAINSMPLLNMVTFNKAVTMSEELSHAAQDSAAQGNLGASDTAGFLTHLVGYYESALFESSFLNALYTGFDDYDRDPYVMPLRDSDGDLQRDAEGNVRANSDQHLKSDGLDGRGLALQSYVDDDGKVQQGYFTESDASTKSRIMAESRLSYALISSLFTGLSGKGMNTRYDMAVKTRKVDKPTMTEDQQMAAILGGYVSEANKALTAGGKQSPEQAIALSFLDHTGNEVLSEQGAMAVFRGLAGGSVTIADASLQGVHIDFDTRTKIQEKWLDELVIEGMRLGLSESSAKFRANKVWYGTGDLPGISEILWSKDLSYSKTQEFQQLNTTYIQGPDGNVWATGFERQRLLGAMGLAPLAAMHTSEDTHSGMDKRLNVVGFGLNNTGMRSLRPVNDSLDTPTDAEIGDAIVKGIEDMDSNGYDGGYGRGGYGGFGRRRGGGGGGGFAQRPVNNDVYAARWTQQRFDPFNIRTPYANDVYSVRTDDVRTDLSLIRRERVSSQRGRLNQWQ